MLLGNYIFESFKAHNCLAAFSLGKLDLGFKDNPGLRQNRALFLGQLGIAAESLVCLQQVHGNTVFQAQSKDAGRGAFEYETAVAGCDGLISAQGGLPLAVFSADCLSVFMLDTANRIAAILHAGWKGTRDRIALSALDIFKNRFNSRAKDIICGFGPCIRNCCYEVSEVFQDYFPDCVEQRREKFFLDLIKINSRQLLSAGVLEKNISDSQICTSCRNRNDEFFSYRKEGQSAGRTMSVIMVK